MIKITDLTIAYQRKILNQVEFEAYRGSVTLIRGESGSGKTSLLYRIALLSNQSDFEYYLTDIDIGKYNTNKKSELRKYHIAYVLQDSALIDFYTVEENIYYYASMVGRNITKEDVADVLTDVKLDVALDRKLETLSGGERQRLAIACALIKNCEIIILDEPTSSLDIENEQNIFELISRLAHNKNKCIIMASHSHQAKKYSDVIYDIQDQQLILSQETENINKTPLKEKVYYKKLKFLFDYVKINC